MHRNPLVGDSDGAKIKFMLSDNLDQQAQEASRFLSSLSKEKIKEINEKVRRDSDKVYREFKEELAKEKCFLCGKFLTNFTFEKPCMHWLLRPAGFDKKHAVFVFKKFNYLRIESFVRWMANSEIPAGNINDLEEEKNPDKTFEYTIKYKNLEWSFSCSKGDIAGHSLAFRKEARSPHYHFQMRIDRKPFIDYGNMHIPFTDEDLWHLPIMLGMVKNAGYANYHGAGMQDMMAGIEPEVLLSAMQKSDDEDEGVYNLQTLVKAEPGKTLSGTELAEIFKKHKETGIPIARLIRDIKNLGQATTYITPGPRVPDQAGRKSGEKKR